MPKNKELLSQLDTASLRKTWESLNEDILEKVQQRKALETLLLGRGENLSRRMTWRDKVYGWAVALAPDAVVTSNSLKASFPTMGPAVASTWMSRMVEEGVLEPLTKKDGKGKNSPRSFRRKEQA